MSELSAAEVCTAGNGGARKFQAWRTLMSWFSFVFQIFWQVVKGTPPFAQVLSFLGGGHPLLSSSPAFKLLPVDSRTDALPTVREADTVAVGRLKDELYKVNEELQNLKEQLQRLHHSVTSGEGIVQADDKSVNDNFVANDPIDNERREKVKEAMIHAWNSYDKYAWGQDELQVVLDLDETLVCAYETSTLHPVIRKHATEAGLDCFELECFSGEKDIDGRQKVNHVTVFERPGLRDFLQQISEFADLILFTAGLEGYARPLVDHIDVDNKFCRRLYRPATVSTEYREHVKDLFIISKNLCRIVIVDNNPFSFLLQPLNGIPCVPFSAGQPNDEQLLGVILPLLKKLSSQKDVRPLLEERFRMPEWFKHHGIPIVDAN